MHWNEAAADSGRSALDRTAEVRRSNARQKVQSQQLVECRPANDRTRAMIDRRYGRGTCRTERELEKEIKLQKLKIKKNKNKNKT